MVMNDRRVTVEHIADTRENSVGSIHTALTEILGISKLSARWVPRILTPEKKLNKLESSRALLLAFSLIQPIFVKGIVTQDETWVHSLTLNKIKQSKQWFSPPKKFKRVPSVGKVVASKFAIIIFKC